MELRTNIRGLICNIGPVINTWSDAARAAAIEAKKREHGGSYADPNAEKHMQGATDQEHLDEIHSLLKAGMVKGNDGAWHRSDIKPPSDKMKSHKERMAKQKQATAERAAHQKYKVDRGGGHNLRGY